MYPPPPPASRLKSLVIIISPNLSVICAPQMFHRTSALLRTWLAVSIGRGPGRKACQQGIWGGSPSGLWVGLQLGPWCQLCHQLPWCPFSPKESVSTPGEGGIGPVPLEFPPCQCGLGYWPGWGTLCLWWPVVQTLILSWEGQVWGVEWSFCLAPGCDLLLIRRLSWHPDWYLR